MRLLDHLLKAVRDAAVFNPEVQVAPACILWPDRDRQWEAVIPNTSAKVSSNETTVCHVLTDTLAPSFVSNILKYAAIIPALKCQMIQSYIQSIKLFEFFLAASANR